MSALVRRLAARSDATLSAGLLFAWLGAGAPAAALDPARAITQYVQQVWRAPRPLPHDNVSALLQTRDGYLWVGTVEGLARFDGVRSVIFDEANTPELGDNWIRALLEDRAGRLWIGTFAGGLSRFDGERFVRFGAESGLASEIVLALHEDRQGTLLVGTGGGLFRFDGERFEPDGPATGAARGLGVRQITEDASGALWIGTEAGLYRRVRGGWERQEGLSDEVVLALAADRQGLWIGTEKGGLDRLVGGRVEAIGRAQGLAHERVWALRLDRDDNLWIGTDGGGLQRLADGRLDTLSTANGLANDFVWALEEDREGGLWVGTNGGGLSRLDAGRVVALGAREGLPSDFVWSVLRARDGALYVGTDDAGLARITTDGVERIEGASVAGDSVKVLLERRDGSLWMGGHHGIARLVAGELRPVELPVLEERTINAMVEDRDGTLWIGSNVVGLYRLSPDVRRAERVDTGIDSQAVTALLAASDGAVWAGTPEGIARVRGAERRVWTRADGLPSSYVTGFFEAPDGVVWAATRGGLVRLGENRVVAVTVREGLFDEAIMSVRLTHDGEVWTGGNRGLSHLPLRTLDELVGGRRERVECATLGLEDGLRTLEINGAGSSSFEDADGTLWFATRSGLAAVSPHDPWLRDEAPPVALEEVLADGARLRGAGPWRLPPGIRRLEIHFTALTFAGAATTRLRHRLEGFDPDWVPSPPHRAAEYTNLPHGRYRFQVAATDARGAWGEATTAFDLEIAPRFYERLAFRVALVVVVVLLGPLVYFVRVWQLRRRNEALERLVAARTAEVAAANVQLAQLAREDGLTGLANRRTFDETLEEEWRRAARLRLPLALLLFDVDHFKAYNDEAGHLAGDASLRAVAGALRRAFQRAGELVARFGGEEFAVLLPALAGDEARLAAEGARERVRHLALPHPASPVADVVTASVGVAWADPADGGTPLALLAAADQALYSAKQAGRDRVVAAAAP